MDAVMVDWDGSGFMLVMHRRNVYWMNALPGVLSFWFCLVFVCLFFCLFLRALVPCKQTNHNNTKHYVLFVLFVIQFVG